MDGVGHLEYTGRPLYRRIVDVNEHDNDDDKHTRTSPIIDQPASEIFSAPKESALINALTVYVQSSEESSLVKRNSEK